MRRYLCLSVFAISLGAAWPGGLAFADGATAALPVITGLSDSTMNRSGYIEVYGSDFEATGRLVIDGKDAFVADWTASRIIGYVPEASAIGPVGVQVFNSAGGSNIQTLDVTLRQTAGRIRWSFRQQGPYSTVRPALGADGTIYSIDVYDNLYALRPDGALLWLTTGAGDKGVDVGPEGTIYTVSSYDVKAYEPDGTLKWVFQQNPSAFVAVGMAVGPDGNVYVVGSQGLGVFSLTPEGDLRWTDPEEYDRPTIPYVELEFGPNGNKDQLYFYANGHVPAIELDGTRNCEIWHAYRSPVSVAPDGSIHMVNHAWSPDCELLWEFDLGSNRPNDNRNGPRPTVGPDGTHYMIINLIHLYALRPNGTQRWYELLPDSRKAPEVTPSNSQILFGSSNTGAQPGFIASNDPKNGRELWRFNFDPIDGFNHFVDTRARVTPDEGTAYYLTFIATGSGSGNASWLHSIDIDPQGPCHTPGEVQGVRFGSSMTRVEWDEVEPGASYDVCRGMLSQLSMDNPDCLASNRSQTWIDDAQVPPAGDGYHYVVRGSNACGDGSWGWQDNGSPRSYGACP